MKVSHATMRGLQTSRLFVRNNVDRFLQASQDEKDAVLASMSAIDRSTLKFEVGGNLILHPYLRDGNLDAELLVEALTQTPIGRKFEAGTVELAGVAEALRRGRVKLDRLNAEIEYKQAELKVIKKTIAELIPQVASKTVELDINTIMQVDEDVPELVAKYSVATPEKIQELLVDATDRVRGVLTFIGRELMGLELPIEKSPEFINGFTATKEYCDGL